MNHSQREGYAGPGGSQTPAGPANATRLAGSSLSELESDT
jgi:hypothetical protein